ncbi:hypothetical protein LCGC14_1112580, partial [marine sediment metagenome]
GCELTLRQFKQSVSRVVQSERCLQFVKDADALIAELNKEPKP